jgi:hypothetical protein
VTTSGIEYTGDSNRHPLNSADGSMVRNTKRYTLVRRVATATTQITIRAIPRHGKLKISDYSLLAQFGLTPKSGRGVATSNPTEGNGESAGCVVM